MDQERQRIQDDLRGLLKGDVRCDDVFLQLYASDASVYQIRPLGVVRPRNTADVVACMQYAAERQDSDSCPRSRHGIGRRVARPRTGARFQPLYAPHSADRWRSGSRAARCRPWSIESASAVVRPIVRPRSGDEPGDHDGKRRVDRRFGQPLVAIRIGAAARHQLASGAGRWHAARSRPRAIALANVEAPTTRRQELVGRLTDLFTRHSQLIAERQPHTMLNQCGYQFGDVLEDGNLDLGRLLVRKRGNARAHYRSDASPQSPLPRYRGVGVLFFDSLENAALAVQEILPFSPCACDLLDRRHIGVWPGKIIRSIRCLSRPRRRHCCWSSTPGTIRSRVRDRMVQTLDRVRRKRRLAFDARQAFDQEEIDLYWQLAWRVVPTLHRMKGTTRPLPFVEDLAVPPAASPRFSRADAEHTQEASGDRVAVWARRPWAASRPPFPRSDDGRRCSQDGGPGR